MFQHNPVLLIIWDEWNLYEVNDGLFAWLQLRWGFTYAAKKIDFWFCKKVGTQTCYLYVGMSLSTCLPFPLFSVGLCSKVAKLIIRPIIACLRINLARLKRGSVMGGYVRWWVGAGIELFSPRLILIVSLIHARTEKIVFVQVTVKAFWDANSCLVISSRGWLSWFYL